MKARFRVASFSVVALCVLCLSVALYGCGDDDGDTPPSPPTGYTELLFVSDGTTLKTASISGAASTERGSATIPGIPGTYTRSGTVVTVTIPNHNLPAANFWVDLVFSPGTGGTATSGQYQVTIVDADTFTVNDSASGTITGGAMIRKPTTDLAATYSQLATVITVTFANHNLQSGDIVKLHFTSGAATDITKTITVLDANTFTVTADSSATTSGNVTVTVGSNYTIFGIAMHPTGKWVYTTSTYECWSGSPFCWGDGLISRFAINWSTGALTFEKATISGVTGRGTPVTLNFSADGTRLFNQDDDLDGIVMWSVDPANGDLTLLDSAGGTSLHGVGVSADGSRIYNGNQVFSVVSTSITFTVGGSGANSNIIVGNTMYCADTSSVIAYSLTDPDAPALIASAPTSTQEVREVAVSNNGSRIVSAGWNGLLSFDYNGSAITPAAAAGSNQYVDGGVWLTSGTRKMFRSASINSAGNLVATAYFTNEPGTSGGIPPSGYMLINLAADGSLSLANDYANNYYSRVAQFYTKP